MKTLKEKFAKVFSLKGQYYETLKMEQSIQ